MTGGVLAQHSAQLQASKKLAAKLRAGDALGALKNKKWGIKR
jgi:hypothetical protein